MSFNTNNNESQSWNFTISSSLNTGLKFFLNEMYIMGKFTLALFIKAQLTKINWLSVVKTTLF